MEEKSLVFEQRGKPIDDLKALQPGTRFLIADESRQPAVVHVIYVFGIELMGNKTIAEIALYDPKRSCWLQQNQKCELVILEGMEIAYGNGCYKVLNLTPDQRILMCHKYPQDYWTEISQQLHDLLDKFATGSFDTSSLLKQFADIMITVYQNKKDWKSVCSKEVNEAFVEALMDYWKTLDTDDNERLLRKCIIDISFHARYWAGCEEGYRQALR